MLSEIIISGFGRFTDWDFEEFKQLSQLVVVIQQTEARDATCYDETYHSVVRDLERRETVRLTVVIRLTVRSTGVRLAVTTGGSLAGRWSCTTIEFTQICEIL